MTQDNGEDRSQKTVAELLAQHGGSSGGRRRHRRAAEEEQGAPEATRSISDTAPQAIIDRIQGESTDESAAQGGGGTRPDGENRHANGAAPPASGPQPPAPQPPAPQPPRPAPQQPSMPMPSRQGRQDTDSVAARLDDTQAPSETPQAEKNGAAPPDQRGAPQRPQRGRGGFPWPPNGRRAPLRPARRAEPEPGTDQFPAVPEPDKPAAQDTEDAVSATAPPAGLAKWRQRRRQAQSEETDVGLVPPVPAEPAEQAPPAQPADQDGGPPTGAFTPTFDTGTQDAVEDYDYFDDGVAENYAGEYDEDYADDEFGDEDYDELDYDDYDQYAEDEDYGDYDEDEHEATGSPARQWLVLAGQLALGVVGGAGVWLGFNWLWGQMPSAALIAALVATLGLVWVVRKVRRADDTQTTVLALLVGLVVTVSPAALLLVSR